MVEIISTNSYAMSKLKPIHEASRSALRKIYIPREDTVFEPLNPLKEKILVVKYGDLEVGTTRVHYYEQRLHILGLGVLDAYRRKGVCSMMIDYLQTEAIRNNMSQISLYTIRETGNVEVFSKFGFEVFLEQITDDFVSEKYDELHEVYMVLNL